MGRNRHLQAQPPEGVTVDSLAHAAATMPELVGKYYNKLADPANPLAALNTMLAQDGLFLHIRKGVKLEKPLQLVDILQYDVPLRDREAACL